MTDNTETPDLFTTVTEEWSDWSLSELRTALGEELESCRVRMSAAGNGLPRAAVDESIAVLRDMGDIMTKRETAASLREKRTDAQLNALAATVDGMTKGQGALLLYQLLAGAMMAKIETLELAAKYGLTDGCSDGC